MKTIHLQNFKGQSTRVLLKSKMSKYKPELFHENDHVENKRLIKGTTKTDYKTLQSIENLGEKMIDNDVEVDFELFGKIVTDTQAIYLNENLQPAKGVTVTEHVYNADDELQDIRDIIPRQSNINTSQPLKWTNIFSSMDHAYKTYCFSNAYQLCHVDSLSYEFLYGMAEYLETKEKMVVIGAGADGKEPLIMYRGALPYRGFLEGITNGDKYYLVLHLCSLELNTKLN